MSHKKNKVISSTSLTENRVRTLPGIDVTKNYSRLPKSNYDPQPNNSGEPAVIAIHKKASKSGTFKDGIKY